MLVLEASIVTFGESLVENARFGSLSGGIDRVQQECPCKSVKEESPERVTSKSVKKECLAKSVKQECQARMSSKSV